MYHLITEEWKGTPITIRAEDAWWNLTEMCASEGKRPVDFLRLPSTVAYLSALAERLGLLCKNLTTNLDFNGEKISQLKGILETRPGRHGSGTWAHPYLAMECARWLAPGLSVRCNEAIVRILNGEAVEGSALSPVQRRLRKQRLKLRGTELRVEIDSVRKQLDSIRSTEDLPGLIAVREWLAQTGINLTHGDLVRLTVRLAAQARSGQIPSGERTIVVNTAARCARAATYPTEAIASTFAALFPGQLVG